MTSAAPAPLRQLDLVLCFDTTGSMYPVLASVKKQLTGLAGLIFAPGSGFDCAVAVVAHGDYDSADTYVTTHMDFSTESNTVTAWIANVAPVNNSWNEGEAYEQALAVMRGLAWRPASKKVVVLVGDDKPHPAFFPGNTTRVDWTEVLADLTAMDVAFYAVQCAHLDVARSRFFYEALARAHPAGQYISLDQFYMMPELLQGLFLHATGDTAGLAAHEQAMKNAGKFSRTMAATFDQLLGRAPAASCGASAGAGGGASGGALLPVAPGRFQRLDVGSAPISIKEFVLASGATFKPGRGFYELTKAEDVGPAKEVVLEELGTADMFSGDAARTILGLRAGVTARVSPAFVPTQYRAFVQSTSNNRKLMPGTKFLYELDATA
jgi:hypothetical protein